MTRLDKPPGVFLPTHKTNEAIMNDVFNYTDVIMKLKNRTDISDFIGKYTLFPDYMKSPKLLNMLKWSQYKLLLFFYNVTLDKHRLSGTFTSSEIEQGAGFKSQHFNEILQELKDGVAECIDYNADRKDKQDETKKIQLVSGGEQSDAKHDPFFHVCDLGKFPKQWQVTFLFPMSWRFYGAHKQSKFHPIAKFWYIGDGQNHKEQCYIETQSGDVYPTLRKISANYDPHYNGKQTPSICVITDFKNKRVFNCKTGDADLFSGDSTCELWIQNPTINEKNHLYMFTWFPLAELKHVFPFNIDELDNPPKFGKI